MTCIHCQNLIRMQRCDGQVAWGKQPDKQWSMACIAQDQEGFVYFIHARSGYMVNTLIHILNEAIPNIRTISYVEGGPESSLSIRSGEFRKDFLGNFETGFWEDDINDRQWSIPNVIGITKK